MPPPNVWCSGFPFRARTRLAGRRLVATNTEWAAGDGELLEAPIERLLLAMTGRLDADASDHRAGTTVNGAAVSSFVDP